MNLNIITNQLIQSCHFPLFTDQDPFTDLLDFYPYVIIHPKYFLDFKEQYATYRLDINTKKVVKLE